MPKLKSSVKSKAHTPSAIAKGVQPPYAFRNLADDLEKSRELNPIQSWEFKIDGKGTSGWMSFVKIKDKWIPLRQSRTSFLSAVTAIEPEVLRLAFPHTKGR